MSTGPQPSPIAPSWVTGPAPAVSDSSAYIGARRYSSRVSPAISIDMSTSGRPGGPPKATAIWSTIGPMSITKW